LKVTNMAVALIIEDDPKLGRDIADALSGLWEPLIVRKWEIGLAYLQHESIGVAVMDLGHESEKLRALSRMSGRVPIIVYGAPSDRRAAMLSGAYHYLDKPPDLHVLVNLVRTASRRSPQAQMRAREENLRFKELVVDPTAIDAFVHGSSIGLTPAEFRLLYELALNVNQPVSRDRLIQVVSGRRHKDRIVTVHISRIRHKIDRCSPDHVFIHAHRGHGYELRPVPRSKLDDLEREDLQLLFRKEIHPLIRDCSSTRLSRITGLTRQYCNSIKKGEYTPHVRHWDAFRQAGRS